jgi:hypothetical protein
MKLPSLRLVLALFAINTAALSAPPLSEPVAETQALAEGYAAAFPQLYQANRLTLVLKRDGHTVVLKDVRKLEAFGGVLLVSVGSPADRFIINPRDIVFVTDAAKYPPLEEPRG